MSVPNPQPAAAPAGQLVEHLVTTYRALEHAAGVAGALMADDLSGYVIGWDVAIAIARAKTDLRNLVTAHNLSRLHAFWTALTPTTTAHIAGDRLAALHRHLAAAYGPLCCAASAAERLVQTDHSYGAIGWDLEIAVDDVMIDVRDAARAAGLHDHPYWAARL